MVTSDLGACEWFVWDLRRSGLIDRGPLDQIVGEYLKRNPRAEAPALAEHLVDQGTLTAFQAERILNGKSQGLILGPYILLDSIGSGSMGQVYRATSKNDNNQYAVKVLPRRSMWNVRLARRQVRSFSTFDHPAVVPFVDVGTAGGLHYLSWPLVEGTTLEALVQQHGKLPTEQAALYAMQVAQGLTIAHQNSLFHGLVKPSNIMIGSDNQARMLDFGIGCLLCENEGESLVDTMSTANTLTSGLDCASPESIMEPTNRTPAGDQYSLGCVLYYCLTGQVPFPEGSAVEKMMAHQMKEPTPIRELVPEVPAGLELVVKRLMAKTPEGRYSGCDDVVEALHPFVGNHQATPSAAPASGSRLHHQAGTTTGLPSRTNPAAKINLPDRRQSPPMIPAEDDYGARPTPAPAALLPPDTRMPSSPPSVRASSSNLPSRASFQKPIAADISDTTPVAKSPTPAELTRGAMPTPSVRSSLSKPFPMTAPEPELEMVPEDTNEYIEEVPERKNPFGPVGLIAAALLLMVSVWYGTYILMK